MAINNVNRDDHPFSYVVSLFVLCNSEEEIDCVYDKLSVGGSVLMSLEESEFGEKSVWVEDRFGVSRQLNLSKRGMMVGLLIFFFWINMRWSNSCLANCL
ncbi:VOC family protein [Rossellomorea sp. FM04394]|uniref:VOC family protein n=1 Tax=Rossellomorea sp. FM04394 TaxID=3243076 RepID=UPI0035A73E7B